MTKTEVRGYWNVTVKLQLQELINYTCRMRPAYTVYILSSVVGPVPIISSRQSQGLDAVVSKMYDV